MRKFQRLTPSMAPADVRAAVGAPTAETIAADGRALWWYVYGPQGFVTWRLAFDQATGLTEAEQVLTETRFKRIEPGWSGDQVLEFIGPPRVTERYPALGETVMVWRYQDRSYNKFLNVHLDPEGRVKRWQFEQEQSSP